MDGEERKRETQRAYGAAMARLRDTHRSEFDALLDEEYQRRGLPVERRASQVQVRERQVVAAREILAKAGKE